MFAGAEVDGGKSPRETLSSFPTDLAANAGGIAGGVDRAKAKESKEDCFKKVPIVGATGEEAAEPEVGTLEFVNVDGGEIAVAAGGDIEAEAIGGPPDEETGEAVVKEVLDFVFARAIAGRAKVAKLSDDFVLFEMDASNFVFEGTLLDRGPFDDGSAGRKRVAKVRLLVDFLEAGAGATVSEELVFGEESRARAVDEVEESEVEGVGHGHSKIQIPRARGD